MKIYYLAHPVRADNKFSEEENLEHALTVQGILYEAGIFTINPWYTYIKLFPNITDEELIEKFLEEDCAVLDRCDGICLTGHRLSSGMQVELERAVNNGQDVLNYIGVPDEIIAVSAIIPKNSVDRKIVGITTETG